MGFTNLTAYESVCPSWVRGKKITICADLMTEIRMYVGCKSRVMRLDLGECGAALGCQQMDRTWATWPLTQTTNVYGAVTLLLTDDWPGLVDLRVRWRRDEKFFVFLIKSRCMDDGLHIFPFTLPYLLLKQLFQWVCVVVCLYRCIPFLLFDISSLLHPLPGRQVVLIGPNVSTQSGYICSKGRGGVSKN